MSESTEQQALFEWAEFASKKTCAYFVRRKWSKTYFKCALWSMAHSESSDIRCHDKVCGKWEPERI